MKIAKVLAIILIGPVIGLVLGFFVGSLFLTSNPSGQGSPGDGFLLILTAGAGFIVFGICSVLIAVRIWRHSATS
jgi:hypothetical protein